jgi:hypothetical protein
MNNKPHRSRSFPAGDSSNFSAPAPRPQIQPMQPVTKPKGWLRTAATLTVPGFVIVGCLVIAEIVAPYDYKPTVLAGRAAALYEVTVIRETLIDKAEAEKLIAEARTDGERRAELTFQTQLKEVEFVYQEKLVTVQTQLQSGLAAYQSLYERANMLQAEAAKMEHTILTNQQAAIRDTQGPISVVAGLSDIGCIFSPEFCKVSDDIRGKMAGDLVQAGTVGRGSVAGQFLRDIPDPAQLQAQIMLPPPTTVQ